MKKKPQKVEENTAPYVAKQPTPLKAAPKEDKGKPSSGDAAFQKMADKIFFERKELLRKLAQ